MREQDGPNLIPRPLTPGWGRRNLNSSDCVMDQLTPREFRVAMLVARGFTNKEIARQLVITLSTVQVDTRKIMKKLGVKSRDAFLERVRQELGSPVAD